MKYMWGILAGAFIAVSSITAMEADKEVRILFTGDVMLGRHVETLMEQHGHNYPFMYVTERFQEADAVIVNLEGPIPVDHEKTENFAMTFSFPSYATTALNDAGVTHVSLANNHGLDQEWDGYHETIAHLSDVGISGYGDPVNDDCANTTTVGDRTIGLITLNDTWAPVSESVVQSCVKEVQDESDFIIAYIHWGEEYVPANDRQTELAHKFIDAGVDAVVGHHPHVVQEVEWYRGKPTFYSLGNFVFDQYFSEEVERGYIVEIAIGKDVEYTLHTIISDKSQPRVSSSSFVTPS